MARPFLIHPLLILLVLLQFSTFMMLTCSATRKFDHKSDSISKMYIKTSCGNTTYPRLCYESLAHHACKIKADPKLLAQAALNTTVYAAKATSKMLKEMSRIHGLKRNEAAAMLDCIADVRDAMQELEKSTREMDVIEGTDVQTKMNDVQMWVNTALEEEETCMNALFSSKAIKGKVKNGVRRHILKVAHLTSNALALVKSYALAQNNST